MSQIDRVRPGHTVKHIDGRDGVACACDAARLLVLVDWDAGGRSAVNAGFLEVTGTAAQIPSLEGALR